ncbi:MAG: (2Fe-2S)-binding protein [Acidobacteriota bacterium]
MTAAPEPSADTVAVAVTVNGRSYERSVEPRLLLSDFLRHELGLTGTHVGCEHGVCGACTILLEGEAVRSCLLFAVQADGHEILTVEGLAAGLPGPAAAAAGSAAAVPILAPDGKDGGTESAAADWGARLHPLQEAFWEAHGLQCGFCTPGFLMTLVPFLQENPNPSEQQIREAISGNLCRCTGYQKIVEAVQLAAQAVAKTDSRPGPTLER